VDLGCRGDHGVLYAYNVLPMDAQAFRCWARLLHRQSDDLIGLMDGLKNDLLGAIKLKEKT
jgi:hypothetical protein